MEVGRLMETKHERMRFPHCCSEEIKLTRSEARSEWIQKSPFEAPEEWEPAEYPLPHVLKEGRTGWVSYLLVPIFFFMLVGQVLAADLDLIPIPVWHGDPIKGGCEQVAMVGGGGGGGWYQKIGAGSVGGGEVPYDQQMRDQINEAVEYARDIAGDFEQHETHAKIDTLLDDPERKKIGLKLLEDLETIWETDEICPNPRHPIFWCLSPDEVNELNQIVGDGIPPYAKEVEAALQEWATNGHENAKRQLQWLSEYEVEFEKIWSHYWKEVIEDE